MALHQLRTVQQLPMALDEAWAFYADPRNLAFITPPDMGFVIHTPLPGAMYTGMLIEYTIRPLLSVPVRWVTEITHISERRYFVDEQRSGPYRLWHHEHHFREVPGGVEVMDLVSYLLPLGRLGDLANEIVVARRLAAIFEYRRAALTEKFGGRDGSLNGGVPAS